MPPQNALQESSSALLKDTLAGKLRERIVAGELRPGQRIVEGRWAGQFGVAQASIREAINILQQEGFVGKAAGRSARVITFTKEDVLHLYEIRAAFEGLAGRLAAERGGDISAVQQALQAMRDAVAKGEPRDLLDADLRFHTELCESSGNRFLVEHARRVLLPFFAFVRIRVQVTHQDTGAWDRDLRTHQRILDLIQEGNGDLVDQYIRHAMKRFAANAYDSWDKDGA